MIAFIRKAPVEDNTASECIRRIAAKYDCSILQLYEYDANCEWHPKNTNSWSIKDSWLRGWGTSASGNIMFYED